MRAPSPPVATLPGGGTVLTPRAFVGRVANVEIWEVENHFVTGQSWLAHVDDAVMFAAYARRKKLWVGTIDVRRAPIGRPCVDDLAVIGARRVDRAYDVAFAAIVPEYRRMGIGVALYIAALAYAWRSGGFALAADACFDSDTSESARRVWASREFRKHAVVGRSGLTAVYRGAP